MTQKAILQELISANEYSQSYAHLSFQLLIVYFKTSSPFLLLFVPCALISVARTLNLWGQISPDFCSSSDSPQSSKANVRISHQVFAILLLQLVRMKSNHVSVHVFHKATQQGFITAIHRVSEIEKSFGLWQCVTSSSGRQASPKGLHSTTAPGIASRIGLC